jgi:monovalent cation:H+ antiporter-2, CPA2 family
MTFAVEIAPPFLVQAVAIVGAAALVAYISQRLGLVPIVGFLIAGIVIGPHALKLVDDPALVNASAEIGVILLLFTIGIEFSLEKLARIKALIFGGGGLQVSLASLCVLGVLAFSGVEWRAALFTGFLVSLSSTAIVLKLLSDRGETASTSGQVTLGLLIFQDLAVIVMVLVVPMLGSGGGSGVGILWALGKALALILAVLLTARRFMPRLLENVALTCSPELFLLTVVAVCFGTAWLTSTVGVSLSLGAFLAGLMVSESRFSHHAFGEIMPLQILFSATFFVSVGMLLDVGFLLRHLPLVLAAVALVLVLKAVTTATSVLALGYGGPVAAAAALTLAQVGEFSFVLDRAGRNAGLSPAGLGDSGSQAFIACTVLLMIAMWPETPPHRTLLSISNTTSLSPVTGRPRGSSFESCMDRASRSSSPPSVRAARTRPKPKDCRSCEATPPASGRCCSRVSNERRPSSLPTTIRQPRFGSSRSPGRSRPRRTSWSGRATSPMPTR